MLISISTSLKIVPIPEETSPIPPMSHHEHEINIFFHVLLENHYLIQQIVVNKFLCSRSCVIRTQTIWLHKIFSAPLRNVWSTQKDTPPTAILCVRSTNTDTAEIYGRRIEKQVNSLWIVNVASQRKRHLACSFKAFFLNVFLFLRGKNHNNICNFF